MVETIDIQKGFQKTDVGMIPSDWEVKTLGVLGNFKKGKNIPKNTLQSNGLPCVLYGEIYTKYNFHASQLTSRISNETAKNATEIKYGDILFAGSGETLEEIGKCFTYSGNEKAFAGGDVVVFTSKNIDPIFLGFLLNSENTNRQKSLLGQGSSVFHIYSSNLKNIQTPLPPTKAEQTVIATTLNDADALITQLEKLIAKKRNIKQGAMQELLKPKEGWEVKAIGEIVDKFIDYRGVTPKKLGMSWGGGNILALSANNVQRGYIDYKKEAYCGSEDLYKRWMRDGDCSKGDILLTMEAPLGNVAYIPDNKKYILSQRTILLKTSKIIESDFLRYLMMSTYFQKSLFQNASGSTAQGIQRKKLEKIIVSFPKSQNVQIKIAQILSDMDAEIEALEKKLKKHKMIKQGMMQNLLTGRIRLIENVEAKGKVIPIDKNSSQKNHNWQINEAVVIAVLAKELATDGYLLSRKRYTKLSYLLHRHVEHKAEGYLKQAAGPYNPSTKYKGPEAIALKNEYIKESKKGQYSGFIAANNIYQAEEYFNQWYGRDVLQWLKQFKFEKSDTLELWTTVDMAVQELKRQGEEVSKEAVKSLIKNTKEWKPKLKRPVFSDGNIAGAILKTEKLFK